MGRQDDIASAEEQMEQLKRRAEGVQADIQRKLGGINELMKTMLREAGIYDGFEAFEKEKAEVIQTGNTVLKTIETEHNSINSALHFLKDLNTKKGKKGKKGKKAKAKEEAKQDNGNGSPPVVSLAPEVDAEAAAEDETEE